MRRLCALSAIWLQGCTCTPQSWTLALSQLLLPGVTLDEPWEPQFPHLKNGGDHALFQRRGRGLWTCPHHSGAETWSSCFVLSVSGQTGIGRIILLKVRGGEYFTRLNVRAQEA